MCCVCCVVCGLCCGSVNGGWLGRVCTTLHLLHHTSLTTPAHLLFLLFLSVSCVLDVSSPLGLDVIVRAATVSLFCSPLGRERLMEYRGDSLSDM